MPDRMVMTECCENIFGLNCCLLFAHWGFHKTAEAMEIERQMSPEECEELERERWEMRNMLDGRTL